MMLTIHGLPSVATYHDVRTLLQMECKINDFILDSMVNDKGGTKKVRIGLADEVEGAHVIKCLDGFRCGGNALYVVPVGKNQQPPNVQPAFNPHGAYQGPGPSYAVQDQFAPPQQVGPGPWNAGNQWAPNQPQMGYNYPQQNVPFQQGQAQQQRPLNQRELMLQASRAPVQDSFLGGSVPPASRPALRNIETVDISKGDQGRYQNYEQPKPITIKKDNFMGPDVGTGSYPQGHGQPSPWQDQGPQRKPGDFRKSNQPYEDDKKYQPKHGILKNPIIDRDRQNTHFSLQRRDSPGRRPSPGRNISPNRRMPDHKIPPNDHRGKMPDHRMPDHGPNDRRMPMNDRMGPNDRRMPSKDDRTGPNDRRMPNNDRIGPNDRRIPMNDERMGPNDRRMASGDRRMPINDDRLGPNDRRMPLDDSMGPNDRRMPGNDERMGPKDWKMSSNDRLGPNRTMKDDRIGPMDVPHHGKVSPGRRVSPVRRHSPGHPGRRDGPMGRDISPTRRRISPSDRRLRSPRRISPKRRMSPESHGRMRYSPNLHSDKPDRLKQVRPAYEPETKASNQPMYSGGFRPKMDEPQVPVVPGATRISPWQSRSQSREKYVVKNEEERRDVISRMSNRSGEQRFSPRASRSPHRRDRSPIRDRYRRNTPSTSPRRSWALEKRRSPEPDAPPPPIWPGQSKDEYSRPSHPDEDAKSPVWANTFVKVKERVPDFEPDPVRVRKDLMHESRDGGSARREPSPQRFKHDDRRDDRYHREPKFERDDFSHDRRYHEPDRKKLPDREEFIARSERAHQDYKKEESPDRLLPREEVYRKKHEQFEDEFQDIYQRAVDFAKKAQELRKHDRRKEHDERRDDRLARDDREFFDRHDHRHDDRPRSRDSDEYRKREPNWDIDPRKRLSPNNLAKREKAVDEICKRIFQKYMHQVEHEARKRVEDAVKDEVFNKIYEMFEDDDTSYIELIIKFNSRFGIRSEADMFHKAATKYSVQYKGKKRPAPDPSQIHAKIPRRTPEPDLKPGTKKPTGTIISEWTATPVDLANQMAIQQMYGTVPQMVMNPFVPVMPTFQPPAPVPPPSYQHNDLPTPEDKDGLHLYLCKDTFNFFLSSEVNDLKEFLVSEIFNTTATNNWAPSFVFIGLQTPQRYELVTQDPNAKNWLLNLDFSGFKNFNVLVYTSEELWYERVAIWLPGHSKCRYIEPFAKLQLQNRKLLGVDIGKWKFVRSIVTDKGTRLYVDVPPSAARALEDKKTLSYELQQVSAFTKASAVDKAAFDSGLTERYTVDDTAIQSAIQNSPMPTLKNELDFVKITVKGYKTLTVTDARKIKDMLVFELFKYLRLGGQSSTDFIKYGLCLPCYFGVVPANEESKKWLIQLNMGNLYRRPIVIIGGEEQNVKRIPLKAYISGCWPQRTMAYVFERIKQSNKGVKGLHFNLWKPTRLDISDSYVKLLIMIDMESVETLASLRFSLDYLDEHCDNDVKTITFKSDEGIDRLLEMIQEYKAEQSDSYVVANMDIQSSETDDDIICLGEATDED